MEPILAPQRVEHAVLTHGQFVFLLEHALQVVLDPRVQSGERAPSLSACLHGVVCQ